MGVENLCINGEMELGCKSLRMCNNGDEIRRKTGMNGRAGLSDRAKEDSYVAVTTTQETARPRLSPCGYSPRPGLLLCLPAAAGTPDNWVVPEYGAAA